MSENVLRVTCEDLTTGETEIAESTQWCPICKERMPMTMHLHFEEGCRCASIGYCTRPGDGDEGDNLCHYCMTRIDPVYSPCPTLGFGDE